MNVTARSISESTAQVTEHFDVLIVGAGISGIGGAYHLTTQLPGTSFVVLETQASFVGTWLTHRYPGIRSDSDLHTFGYSFKPWVGPPIATAEEILTYMGEVKTDTGEGARFTANFLWMCQGYYRHSEGYTPEWPDTAKFKGRIVHPQLWP